MKIFFKGLLLFVFIAVILYIGLFAFVNIRGRRFLSERIKAELGVEPEIGGLSLRFPLTLRIDDFNLGDLSFWRAEASLAGYNPFLHSLTLNKVYLDQLEVKITHKEGQISIAPFYSKQLLPEAGSKNQKEKIERDSPLKQTSEKKASSEKKLALRINNFYLNDSTIKYLNKSRKETFKSALFGLEAEIRNFYYPKLTKFYLNLNSSFKANNKTFEDLFTASGWLDYYNKNMDLSFEAGSLAYSAFSFYYPPFWRAENLGVKEAFLSLDIGFEAEENDLIIDTVMTLDKIEFIDITREDEGDLSRQRLLKTIINLLKGEDGKARLRVKLETKMDSPEITPNLIRKGFIGSLPVDSRVIGAQIIDRTTGIIREGAGQTIRLPKETVDKAVDTIKDTIGIIKDIFVPVD